MLELDPDPDEMNADPQPCGRVLKILHGVTHALTGCYSGVGRVALKCWLAEWNSVLAGRYSRVGGVFTCCYVVTGTHVLTGCYSGVGRVVLTCWQGVTHQGVSHMLAGCYSRAGRAHRAGKVILTY